MSASAGKDLANDLNFSQTSKGGVKRKQKTSEKKDEALVKLAGLSATPLSEQPESIVTESKAHDACSDKDSEDYSVQQLPLVPPAVNMELQRAREQTRLRRRPQEQLLKLKSFQFCLRSLPVIRQLSAMMLEQKTSISGAQVTEYEASESGTSICSH